MVWRSEPITAACVCRGSSPSGGKALKDLGGPQLPLWGPDAAQVPRAMMPLVSWPGHHNVVKPATVDSVDWKGIGVTNRSEFAAAALRTSSAQRGAVRCPSPLSARSVTIAQHGAGRSISPLSPRSAGAAVVAPGEPSTFSAKHNALRSPSPFSVRNATVAQHGTGRSTSPLAARNAAVAACGPMASCVRRAAVPSKSLSPMRNVDVVAPGGPLQPRTVSPLSCQGNAHPARQRLVARVGLASSPCMVQVPAQVMGSQQNQLLQAAQVCTFGLPPSSQSLCITDSVKAHEHSRTTIDGSVATLLGESEGLPQDSVASTLHDVKMSPGAVTAVFVPVVGETDSTLEWIDKQIWTVEHRRDACEMRQAHFADLRRRVGQGEHGLMTRDRDSLLAKEPDAGSSLLRRLAMLEGEHDQLKQEIEDERGELLRLRNRFKDVGVTQSTAAEVSIRQLDIAQEATGADYRQLEEASRAVLGDCRALQQRICELEVERAALIDAHASVEQERQSLQAKIKQVEAETSLEIHANVEAQLDLHRSRSAVQLAALSADLEAARQERDRLETDKAAEAEALHKTEQRHWEALKDIENLKNDRSKLQVDREREIREKEEVLKQRDGAMHDFAQLRSEKESETRAKDQELERRHQALAAELEQVKSEKGAEVWARQDVERRHEGILQELQCMKSAVCKLEADKDAANILKQDYVSQHEITQKEIKQLEADHQKLQEELCQVASDRDRCVSERDNMQRDFQEAMSRLKLAYEAESLSEQSLHTEEIARLKQAQEEETEHLKTHHHGMRAADQKLIDEMQAKLAELEKHRLETVAGLRREMDQLEQRHGEAHRTESGQIQSLRSELESAHKQCETLEQELKDLKETEEKRIQRLQREKAEIAADLDQTRKQKDEMRNAESALQSAVRNETELCENLKSHIKQLQAQLREASVLKEQDRSKDRHLRQEVEQIAEQLQHEQQEGKTLKLALDDVSRAGEDLQQHAKDALQKSGQLTQQLETVWRQKLEENDMELQALKHSADRARIEHSGKRASLSRPSLLAEPILPALQDDEIRDVDHAFVVKVREAHAGVGIDMANADQVHLQSLHAQFQSASSSLNNGMSPESGFYGYDLKPQIDAERHAAASRLESRMHDLIALGEEVSVHHDLDGLMTKQRIFDYINRDIARCEEEMQLLKPSATWDVPEAVIRIIITLMNREGSREYTGGFSPVHWAAEKGRRDLLLFILQQRGGETMLEATDDLGRTPLFYADRSKRIGLVYWVQSRIGSEVPSFKPVEKRPEVSKLPSAYKQLLEQIETRGWHTVTWKDNVTMLHWAAGKGNKDLCTYLLQLNADPSVRDSQARTPASFAAAAGHGSIAQLLEVSGRRTSYSSLAFKTTATTE